MVTLYVSLQLYHYTNQPKYQLSVVCVYLSISPPYSAVEDRTWAVHHHPCQYSVSIRLMNMRRLESEADKVTS